MLTPPTFAVAARFLLKLGFVSFGGPAGQIAIMHREVVERRQWLGERDFTGALNFCMLLPGPEALQLAIYLGGKLHGFRGGLVAGLGFIGPAIVLLLGLSWLYARFGHLPAATGLLLGLKAAVLALVLQALLRIGRRALGGPLHVALAIAAFVALEVLGVQFPLIVLAAGATGLAAAWRAPRSAAMVQPAPRAGAPLRVALAGLGLWLLPLLAVALTLGPQSLWSRLYVFFTQEGHELAETSPLQTARISDASRRLDICRKAILERDFEAFAEIVELDCNLMHAVMLTSTPKLIYWQSPTLAVIQAVLEWRRSGLPVCYTIDAGPNVHVICLAPSADRIAANLRLIPGVQDVLLALPGGPARLETGN